MEFTAAQITQLETALADFIDEMVLLAASPGPDYTKGNQTVNKAAYMKQLQEQIEQLEKLIAKANSGGDAWEVRSELYS